MFHNFGIKGIHVVQHTPIDQMIHPGEQLEHFIKGQMKYARFGELMNPVAAVICLKNAPKTNFSHMIDRTDRQNMSRPAILRNALTKYPQTEMIVLEGGQNIILYSSQPFD